MNWSIRQLLGLGPANHAPAVPRGQRLYAVGDIHGRADLFDGMMRAIEEDDAAAAPARTTVILLGDLVDRGPDSSGVLERTRMWQQQRTVRVLTGNHEEMFLGSFEKSQILHHFLRFGGRETLQSYGLSTKAKTVEELDDLRMKMRRHIPGSHIAFLSSFEDIIKIGDYVFVHAGIAPDVPLADQVAADLRWIREPFLSNEDMRGYVVIHGHTIVTEPELRPNRIGIDTGAYESGRLTALSLEGTSRKFIEVRKKKSGALQASIRKAE